MKTNTEFVYIHNSMRLFIVLIGWFFMSLTYVIPIRIPFFSSAYRSISFSLEIVLLTSPHYIVRGYLGFSLFFFLSLVVKNKTQINTYKLKINDNGTPKRKHLNFEFKFEKKEKNRLSIH